MKVKDRIKEKVEKVVEAVEKRSHIQSLPHRPRLIMEVTNAVYKIHEAEVNRIKNQDKDLAEARKKAYEAGYREGKNERL